MKLPLRLPIVVCIAALCMHGKAAAGSEAPAKTEEAAAGSVPAAATSAIIPGPLRSFLRMAAISQKITPEEVVPLLARNVVMEGYRGWQTDSGKPTEFLILLNRYLHQARALQALAGPGGTIRVSDCESSKPLLAVLGYRLRGDCGKDTLLETDDAERAFLTIDSGFPLSDLEDDLREGKPFAYTYPSTTVPVLFSRSDWTSTDKFDPRSEVVDALMRDPELARLYWALARMDEETRTSLRQSPGLTKLLPHASVLDFYGSQITIREGRVMVPGGESAEAAWKELVGAGPEAPAEFVLRLLNKDKGWLAAYYDALSRISKKQQAYFSEPQRLGRFYRALRGRNNSVNAARPVFRPDPGLLLLMTRLPLDEGGEPEIPGGIEVWRSVLRRKSESPLVKQWARRAGRMSTADELVEALVGLSRVTTEGSPLQVFLAISEIDRNRSGNQKLNAATVRLLADHYAEYSDQYLMFSEFQDLDNASIARFLSVGDGLDRIANRAVRANAVGLLQANLGLWQILARQQEIPAGRWNESWQKALAPFSKISSSAQLFDAGRASLGEVLRAAGQRPNLSQDEILNLLAGPRQDSPGGEQVRQELANRMRAVLEGQRLMSLDSLFALGDGLQQMAEGRAVGESLMPLAETLKEFEMPRPLFTTSERSEWASWLYNNRHSELQTRTDLTKVISSAHSPEELAGARGQLTPFLRDTLVGINYAYYEPPGAQMLHNNPLLVRAHDFLGDTIMTGDQAWRTPRLFGAGLSAGRGAHLVGSLADLPYVLAEIEEDFIVPENTQALIWKELVPTVLSSAVLPRWWRVTRNELHAASLYQRAGEELLEAASGNAELQPNVLGILADRMLPRNLARLGHALRSGRLQERLGDVTPSDLFYLTAEFRRRFPADTAYWGAAGKELDSLIAADPEHTSWARLSEDFGVPHPALAQSNGRELLNIRPFPAFMGYASRLLAESWDSSNLYWARLADEQGYSPVMLNRLVPQLTRRMVEKIFATDFEDWPAVLRAMQETGEEFRHGKMATLTSSAAVAQR